MVLLDVGESLVRVEGLVQKGLLEYFLEVGRCMLLHLLLYVHLDLTELLEAPVELLLVVLGLGIGDLVVEDEVLEELVVADGAELPVTRTDLLGVGLQPGQTHLPDKLREPHVLPPNLPLRALLLELRGHLVVLVHRLQDPHRGLAPSKLAAVHEVVQPLQVPVVVLPDAPQVHHFFSIEIHVHRNNI